MKEHRQDFPRRYLRELTHALRRSGFEMLPVEQQHLPVRWEGRPLCRVSGQGAVLYREEASP